MPASDCRSRGHRWTDHEIISMVILALQLLQEGVIWPALETRSDACLTGDQEIAGSIPYGSGNILSWRLNNFSTVILPLLLIQEGQLSISGERMCKSTDKGLSPQVKSNYSAFDIFQKVGFCWALYREEENLLIFFVTI